MHDYNQDPATLRRVLRGPGERARRPRPAGARRGSPASFPTTGGGRTSSASTAASPGRRATCRSTAWGYGQGPETREEFLARFRGLTEALLFNPGVSGLCYTQLTDVEQEINGLLTYDRRAKFPPEVIASILKQKAAVEG